MFKKKKIKKSIKTKSLIDLRKKYLKSTNKNRIIGRIIGFISVVTIIYIGSISLNKISELKLDLSFISGFGKYEDVFLEDTDKNKNKVQKEKVNILITGKGGGNHEAPMLTDSIILASINLKKSLITMLSIPRDLFVEYDENNSVKINEIVMKEYYKTLDYDKAMKKLSEKVEEITGEKVDNYLSLDFNGFIKIVDLLGGIEVEIPENFIDNSYPDGNRGYTTFMLKKGVWTLDGNVALKYARSRHSTSDFDRSLRQQTIINAIKEKITDLGYISNPNKIKGLYLTLKENIKTDLKIEELISLAFFSKNIEKENILSFNLNDSCYYGSDVCEKGGFLYVPLRSDFNNLSVLLAYGTDKKNLSNYSKLHLFTNIIFNFPNTYIENYQINIFNSTKIGGLASNYADNLIKYGLNIPKYNSVGNVKNNIHEKSTIYYNNIPEDSKTLKALDMFIFGPKIKTDKALFSSDPNTKIEIVIGNDYKYLIY